MDEGPFQVEGARDGQFLRYRYFSDDGDTTIETRIVTTQGPLLCEMTLTGLDGPNEERDRLFEAIAKTLALHNTQFLSKAEPITLLPPPDDAPAERTSHPRSIFPAPVCRSRRRMVGMSPRTTATCCSSDPVPPSEFAASSATGVTAISGCGK